VGHIRFDLGFDLGSDLGFDLGFDLRFELASALRGGARGGARRRLLGRRAAGRRRLLARCLLGQLVVNHLRGGRAVDHVGEDGRERAAPDVRARVQHLAPQRDAELLALGVVRDRTVRVGHEVDELDMRANAVEHGALLARRVAVLVGDLDREGLGLEVDGRVVQVGRCGLVVLEEKHACASLRANKHDV